MVSELPKIRELAGPQQQPPKQIMLAPSSGPARAVLRCMAQGITYKVVLQSLVDPQSLIEVFFWALSSAKMALLVRVQGQGVSVLTVEVWGLG